MEPKIQKSLSKNAKDKSGKGIPGIHFKFTKTDFGSIPPKISNITTRKVDPDTTGNVNCTKSIVIDFDVEYLGDCDIQVSLMGISSGVR